MSKTNKTRKIKKTEKITIRCTSRQKKKIIKKAKEHGLTITEYLLDDSSSQANNKIIPLLILRIQNLTTLIKEQYGNCPEIQKGLDEIWDILDQM